MGPTTLGSLNIFKPFFIVKYNTYREKVREQTLQFDDLSQNNIHIITTNVKKQIAACS